jgi:hypothetical protein
MVGTGEISLMLLHQKPWRVVDILEVPLPSGYMVALLAQIESPFLVLRSIRLRVLELSDSFLDRIGVQ